MSFADLQYPFFLILVIIIFYRINHKYRWILLLAASYYFYSCWNPKYLLLIIFSTLVDYYAGIKIAEAQTKKTKKLFLILSLFINLSLLFTFKYFTLFASTTNYILDSLNILQRIPLLDLLLPVGISFYTFQSLSYIFDVYRSRIKAEYHLGIFALYVSFFPQLVAGPIEKASHLIPQLHKKIFFNETLFREGLREILWGFFKKIVIADYLSVFVDKIYLDPIHRSSLLLVLATYFFGIQVYCDFSGYSNIAIGSAKLLGVNLMKNFDKPFFAHSLPQFWQKWHISLMLWFKDYIFLPMKHKKFLALFLVFLVSGFWHGAKWTQVLWGVYQFFLYLLSRWLTKAMNKVLPQWIFNPLSTFITFNLVSSSWILFRANSLSDTLLILNKIFNTSLASWQYQIMNLGPMIESTQKKWLFNIPFALILIIFLFSTEYFQDRLAILQNKTVLTKVLRWLLYIVAITLILFFYKYATTGFIYFQF